MTEMRLQRFMAQAGIASRRKAEELIEAGRVKVNGRVVRELGVRINPLTDRVDFDGSRLVAEDHQWLLLNKPDKTVSTVSDPEGRETVLDVVGSQGARLYPVGRLDYHTEGVLLLTNDGELANALMHPRNQIARIYHVKVKGIIDPDVLETLRQGVKIDERVTVSAKKAMLLGNTGKHTWVEVTLTEGRNRQIHRMMEAVNLEVLKLIRVSYAGLTTEDIPPGKHRSLTQAEINQLRAMVKLAGETRREPTNQPRRGRRREKVPPRDRQPNRGKPQSPRSKGGHGGKAGRGGKGGQAGKAGKAGKAGRRGQGGHGGKAGQGGRGGHGGKAGQGGRSRRGR